MGHPQLYTVNIAGAPHLPQSADAGLLLLWRGVQGNALSGRLQRVLQARHVLVRA
jgi:hypothetical protein